MTVGNRREGGWPIIVRAVRGGALAAFLVLYALNSPLLRMFTLPFADGLRISGVALGILSLILYAWSRSTLGSLWSSQIQLRKGHRLIVTGPYAYVRHPIYVSLILFMAGISIITANGFLLVFLGISAADLLLRTPKEEQMMIERFGEAYKKYQRRTRRWFPKYKGR